MNRVLISMFFCFTGTTDPVSPSGKGIKWVILNAKREETGLILGCDLVFKAQLGDGDYHKKTETRTKSTSNTRKNEMIQWLKDNNITFPTYAKKPKLYEIIKRNKSAPVYKLDVFDHRQGHFVLRLTVRHCELNPMELFWAPVYKSDVFDHHQGNFVLRLTVRHCELNPMELFWAPVYKSDVFDHRQGHFVLRLTVRQCELNPMELCWAPSLWTTILIAVTGHLFRLPRNNKKIFAWCKWQKTEQLIFFGIKGRASDINCK
ncbi:hypothetical protein KUTeg_005041, partial [Tegillarca granosa]